VSERPPLLFVAGSLVERRLDGAEHLVDGDRRPRTLISRFSPVSRRATVTTPAASRERRSRSEGHPLQLPLVELEPGPVVAIVDTDANARRP
jgi:hypothetical protein